MQLRAAHGQIDCQIYRRTMEQRHGGGNTLGPYSHRDQRQRGSEYSSEAGYRVEAKETQKRQSYGAGYGLEGKAGYVGLAP